MEEGKECYVGTPDAKKIDRAAEMYKKELTLKNTKSTMRSQGLTLADVPIKTLVLLNSLEI